MEHLHIRLPLELKSHLKKHCRDQNIAVTSAIITMIVRELRERSLTLSDGVADDSDAAFLGFILRQ